MSKHYLGIDIGGTKTHALLTDGSGDVLDFREFGPGNPEMIGYDGFHDLLEGLLTDITREAQIDRGRVSAVGMGIGGYDWPFQRKIIREIIASLKLRGKVRFENDVILGLIAGASHGWGVCINAGTSFNCRGLTEDGRQGRVIGEGMEWGEGAGAVEVVQKAIQQVGAAWTRRGDETALSAALLSHYNLNDMLDLLGKLATHQVPVDPQFAPQVFEYARQGDRIANQVVQWAGQQLGELGIGVIRQLALENSAFEIVLSGSMFNAGESILKPVADTILPVAPQASFVRLRLPPVIGGALLALQADGVRDAERIDRFKTKLSVWARSP